MWHTSSIAPVHRAEGHVAQVSIDIRVIRVFSFDEYGC